MGRKRKPESAKQARHKGQTIGHGRPRILSPDEQPAAEKQGWRPRLLLREVRLALDVTQAELARRLKTAQSKVSEWETGQKFPSWGSLDEIAGVLGLKTLDQLIDPRSKFGQDNPPPA